MRIQSDESHRFTNYPDRDLRYEVVGVVRDTIHDKIARVRLLASFIFRFLNQWIESTGLPLPCAARCTATGLAEPVRRQIQSIRSTLLITNVSTMEKQVEQALLRERLVASLSTAFGTVALVLASIGLYGILAYAVTRRTNEIGIRMALGATRSGVVWMILQEGLALVGAGILIGVPVVLAIGRFVRASLYGVEPFDPTTYASVALMLVVWAAVAAILPGRRASLLHPSIALRRE